MADLTTDVRYIKGIGEQRAKALGKLGIRTLRDLISWFPRRYEDRTTLLPIAELPEEGPACSSSPGRWTRPEPWTSPSSTRRG